jgi:hypothetical protein
VLVAEFGHSNLFVSLLAANACEHLGGAVYPVAHRLKKACESDPTRPAQEPTWVARSRDAIVERMIANAAAVPTD